jgi:hypothetical protein
MPGNASTQRRQQEPYEHHRYQQAARFRRLPICRCGQGREGVRSGGDVQKQFRFPLVHRRTTGGTGLMPICSHHNSSLPVRGPDRKISPKSPQNDAKTWGETGSDEE